MSLWRSEALFVTLLRGCAWISGGIILLILGFLLGQSGEILSRLGLGRFFSDAAWYPTSGQYNLLPMLWGSLFVTWGAVAIVVPLGLFSAIFCQYFAPPMLAKGYRRMVELLAGIPSVVYGFWGLVTLVPMIAKWQPPGASLLAGMIVLGLMILPTIALVAESSLANVPVVYLRGAAALGLNQWAIVWGVAIPAARAGLMTGVILATGRAIGETMAVLMVCGNVVQVPNSLFAPVRTLTANIALEMAYATNDHRSALFVTGLVLMILIAVLVVLIEVVNRGRVYD